MQHRTLSFLALGLALLLGGCASTWTVSSDVEAFTTSAPGLAAGARYRFERLPSQQHDPQHERLEPLAEAALQRAGLVRDDAGARYTAQLSVRSVRVLDPHAGWAARPGPWGWSGRLWVSRGWGYGPGWSGYPPEPTRPWRELALVLRDAGTGQVIYETRAASDSTGLSEAATLAAMLDAALQGFPSAPAGLRRIAIDVPR